MYNSKEIFEIFIKLGSTNSSLEKIAIIKENQYNYYFKKVCKYATDNRLVFNVKQYTVSSCATNITSHVASIENMFAILDNLYERVYTGNAALAHIDKELSQYDVYIQNLFRMCIDKDLKCGVSNKLLAKVWPEFDNTPKLCKAQPYSEKNIAHIKYPAYSELKADGARCLIFIENNNVTAFSSNGIEFELPFQIVDALLYANQKYVIDRVVLDGELLCYDKNDNLFDRKKGNGIINKLLKGTISEEEKDLIAIQLWDIINYSEYTGTNVDNKKRYSERKSFLSLIIRYIDSPKFKEIPTTIVFDKAQAVAHFQDMLALGLEGTILKNTDFYWEPKRSKHCVKFKKEIDITLKIIEIKAGKPNTKFENSTGALLCTTDCGILEVNVGSGLTDELRDEIWNNQNKYINTYIDVRSNGIIDNKTNETYSLFLPRFIKERTDKTNSDTIEYIMEQNNKI